MIQHNYLIGYKLIILSNIMKFKSNQAPLNSNKQLVFLLWFDFFFSVNYQLVFFVVTHLKIIVFQHSFFNLF